VTLRLAMTFET